MSNDNHRAADNGDGAAERALQELFAHAEPRESPPAADEAEIRAAVYAEWDALTGRRLRWRRVGAWAAAAAVLAAVAFFALDRGPSPEPPTLARVERVQGIVRLAGEDKPIAAGDDVPAGVALTTGAGQLGLRLLSGGSLRLATNTRMTLVADARVDLESGALYFDSEAAFDGQRLTVATPFGTVSDIGTQFIAALKAARLEVGVRDGDVVVVRGTERHAAAAGEKLTVRGGTGAVRREPISTFGGDWAWTERVAPPFDIDGRTLIDFLEWVAAQTGRTLAFVEPRAEQIARDTVLSGSIDLAPMEKLTAVLALTDLSYTIDGGRILIAAK